MIGMGAGSDMHKNMQANRAKTRTGKGKNKSLKEIQENYNTYSGKIIDKNKMSNEEMNSFIQNLQAEKKKKDTIMVLTAVGIIIAAALFAFILYY